MTSNAGENVMCRCLSDSRGVNHGCHIHGVKPDATEYVRMNPSTLAVTHVHEGEEVITGGQDGQVYVATFASEPAARAYVDLARKHLFCVKGVRHGKQN